MTITQIVDTIYPVTKEDRRCAFNMAKKWKLRNELVVKINHYKQGENVELPAGLKELLDL